MNRYMIRMEITSDRSLEDLRRIAKILASKMGDTIRVHVEERGPHGARPVNRPKIEDYLAARVKIGAEVTVRDIAVRVKLPENAVRKVFRQLVQSTALTEETAPGRTNMYIFNGIPIE